MRSWRNKTHLAWPLIIFFVCSFSSIQQNFIDDLGNPLTLTHPPRRIISLAPNITELLFALGLEDKIIAVTQYCNYPPQAREKPSIGGYINPQLEKIISFNPDLILGFRGNPLTLIHQLRQLNLPIFVLDEGKTISSLLGMIHRLGEVTFQEDKAAGLSLQIERRLKRLEAAISLVSKRPRVLLLLQGPQLWTCGRESYLNDLIIRAGGENIMKNIQRAWIVAQVEDIIVKNPEVIIILAPSKSKFNQTRRSLSSLPLFHQISAVKKGKIYYLNEDLVSRLSPRVIEALYQLAQILHPELTISHHQ